MANVFLSLIDWNGKSIKPFVETFSLNYARSFGTVGILTAEMPTEYEKYLQRDSPAKLFRTPIGGSSGLEAGAIWFCRKLEHNYTTDSLKVTFEDQNTLLKRRLIGYLAQTIRGDKTIEESSNGPADDLMKEFAAENVGSPAPAGPATPAGADDTARNLEAYFSVAAAQSLAPTVEIAASFQNLVTVLNNVANLSLAEGYPLFYDVGLLGDFSFEFRTFTQNTAIGDSPSIVKFENDNRNITDIVTTIDWSGEKTVAYLGLYGSGSGRNYERIVDTSYTDLTPFNWIEQYKDLGEDWTAAKLADDAGAIFFGTRARMKVAARVVDSPIAVYGRDFYYGDYVQLVVGGRKFNCHISSVENRYSDGVEDLNIRLVGTEEI